jgi:hypothetical protein
MQLALGLSHEHKVCEFLFCFSFLLLVRDPSKEGDSNNSEQDKKHSK